MENWLFEIMSDESKRSKYYKERGHNPRVEARKMIRSLGRVKAKENVERLIDRNSGFWRMYYSDVQKAMVSVTKINGKTGETGGEE